MQFFPLLRITACAAALCLNGLGQTAPPAQTPAPAKDAAAAVEMKGMAPRTAATEYQAHAQAGTITIAAEFTGHAIGTSQGTLTNDDYVMVEAAFFGPEGARTKLAADDFSLRINGKKQPLAAQPYALVFESLKDPEWEPAADKSKSKSGMTGGGGGGGKGEDPPTPPKMPFPLRRAMEQRVQKATLPEGDRALPVAGLIFFQYRGKTQGIKSIELIYSGLAGKATLALQ